jgi:predicted  nucleic acid-binding Zn-ribbon protein
LKSLYSLEVDKVSQSAKVISTLEQNLKEKEKTIDKMRAAGSNLKSILFSEQQKTEELEAEKVSLGKELEASRGRLQTLESFTVQQLELDENSMQVKLTI